MKGALSGISSSRSNRGWVQTLGRGGNSVATQAFVRGLCSHSEGDAVELGVGVVGAIEQIGDPLVHGYDCSNRYTVNSAPKMTRNQPNARRKVEPAIRPAK